MLAGGLPAVEPEAASLPWSSLLRHRAVWAFLLANILTAPAWGFYQFFLPDFLSKHFNLETQAAGWWTAVFFGLAVVGGVAGGWFAGKLIDRGWSVHVARKVTLLLCALAVVPVFLAPYADNELFAVLIVGLAGSAHQGWSANLFSFVSDTMPKATISSVVGLGGFVAHFAGGFVNGVVGLILQKTGSYILVFGYFSGMYLVALFVIQLLMWVPARPKPVAPVT